MPIVKPKLGEEVPGTWLTPIRYVETVYQQGAHYEYQCRCGNTKVLRKANVKSTNSRSCGCIQKLNQQSFVKKWSKHHKGKPPWNKGLKGMKSNAKGHPNLSWKKGKIKIEGSDGSVEWVKVSDQAIGSNNKWYKRKQQLGIT